MSKNEKNDMLNPEDYFYREGQKVEINRELYREVERLIEMTLEKEEKQFYQAGFLDINQEGLEASKKDIAEGNSQKVMDIRTLLEKEGPDTVSFTKKGLALLALKLRWQQIHYDNVIKGVAVPIQELIEEESKSRMKLQEEVEAEVKPSPLTVV